MRYLLDANVFVHLGNHSKGVAQIVNKMRSVGIAQCFVSSITVYEVRLMILRGPGRVKQENIERLKVALASVNKILPITAPVAEKAAELRSDLIGLGRDIGGNDCLTAAHAMVAGLTCVTANRKHFDRVPGLLVEDWSTGYKPA